MIVVEAIKPGVHSPGFFRFNKSGIFHKVLCVTLLDFASLCSIRKTGTAPHVAKRH